ncbi:hypothetical protein OIU34_27895 [Pararhizobium sp. BT-229]|uniref:hypothetical protein n=1 Tax=Pararhizobium sp. BT-229 TaxID=2986923 RepID=UPI0021F6CE67|nr:hypothetical protein [Pararhizobium sp. BT-229]MCV9965700.1 hypothetical protein [Pararhizobium sp. BT-229]
MPTIGAAAHDIQYSGPVDDIAAALAFHNGDVRATIIDFDRMPQNVVTQRYSGHWSHLVERIRSARARAETAALVGAGR